MQTAEKINLAIITARNIKTSTGSTSTVLNLVNNLDETKYNINLILIDDLVPGSMLVSEQELQRDPVHVPFSLLSDNKKISHFYNLIELTLFFIKKNFDVAIVAIYNVFGEDGRLLGLLETLGIPYLSPLFLNK